MAVNKLPEFAKNGQKNTDGLIQEDGFPVNVKPARQWFNFLFNELTKSINQIIDEGYVQTSNIVDNLTTNDAKKPLSAKMGKYLQDNKVSHGDYGLGKTTEVPRDQLNSAILVENSFWQRGSVPIASDTPVASAYKLINFGPAAWNSQLVIPAYTNQLFLRSRVGSGGAFKAWSEVAMLDSNVASASKLATARKIGGVDFDGTEDIDLPSVNKKGNQDTSGNAEGLTTLGRNEMPANNMIDKTWALSMSRAYRTGYPLSYGNVINMAGDGWGQLLCEWGSATNKLMYRAARDVDKVWSAWETIAYESSNVASATKLAIARTVAFSGAATGSFSYDGSANSSCVLTLANSGVVANTYASTIQIPAITVNAKGLIISISQQAIRSATTGQTGVVQLNNSLTSDSVTEALTAAQGKALQDNKVAHGDYGLGKTITIPDNQLNAEISVENSFWSKGTAPVPSDTPVASAYKLINFGPSAWNSQLVIPAYENRLFLRSRGISNGAFKAWSEVAMLDSNVASASKLATARAISIAGAAIGSSNFDGSGNITINTVGLGVGQTWQNLTASRALNTTYTNSSGKPIFVSITINGTATYEEQQIIVGGVAITGKLEYGGTGATTHESFLVPTGATYRINVASSATVDTWAELR